MARSIRRRVRPPLPAILAELYASIEERDIGNVERVCELEARRLPREVREEAMAVARTPMAGHRAPIQLLVFWRKVRVLELADRAEAAMREQLELDLRAAAERSDRSRSRRASQRGVRFGLRRRRDESDARHVDNGEET